MTLENPEDYDKINQGDEISIEGFALGVATSEKLTLVDKTTGASVNLKLALTERQRKILSSGGLLNYTKENS